VNKTFTDKYAETAQQLATIEKRCLGGK